MDQDTRRTIAAKVAPASRRCPCCTAGKVEEWGAGHVFGGKPCDVCGGTGVLPDPMPAPAEFPVRIAA